MGQKIKLDDDEYEVENLSDQAKQALASFKFATARLRELSNMQALLQRAKNSYIEDLKKEMLTDKAGFLFEEE